MSSDRSMEQLLRWRLAQAEAEAPPAPRALRLLELARPWWETWPERFAGLVERLGRMPVAYGHAMSEPQGGRGGHSVPALIVQVREELETSVRLLYLDLRHRRLRIRFQLEAVMDPPTQGFEVTFVPEEAEAAPFVAPAIRTLDREYRLETELPDDVARQWAPWKVTHRIPYRLILRPGGNG